MTNEKLELVESSDNMFADFGFEDARMLLIKADTATEIVKILNHRKLTGVQAAKLVGETEANISRIRNADLTRFTLDKLLRIMARLDRQPTITFKKVASVAYTDAHA